jgi:hypothetical protein
MPTSYLSFIPREAHPPVTGKFTQQSTSILAFHERRIQARHENIVKILVKFIRQEIWYEKIKVGRNGETFCAPHTGNGSRDSKWWSLSVVLYFQSWGNTYGYV